MLIDTHCHINMMIKKEFEKTLSEDEIQTASLIIEKSNAKNVTKIINVGTSLIESLNCVTLAQRYKEVFATVGLHPNDCTENWHNDLNQLKKLLSNPLHKIVGIGECGLDFYRPGFDKQRQYDAFKAQIELALEYDLALVVHTRNAGEETLRCLEEYVKQNLRAVIHCFSEDIFYAQRATKWNLYIGIGGTVTYPKNEMLRSVVKEICLEHIVLETDAPFLPPQNIRGKQNSPAEIATIAQFIADLIKEPYEDIAHITSQNAKVLFKLHE